jgi:FlaG/FlaF family flagellin (archaellin)
MEYHFLHDSIVLYTSSTIATISLVAVTAIFAATIAIGTFSNSAFAAAGQLAVGAPQSNAKLSSKQ